MDEPHVDRREENKEPRCIEWYKTDRRYEASREIGIEWLEENKRWQQITERSDENMIE